MRPLHACCSNSGQTFVPSNAMDGNPATYWNNANVGSTHSWLEISTPAPVTLPGSTFLSSSNGAPADFQIQTLGLRHRAPGHPGQRDGNSSVSVARLFPAPVTTQHVRIDITLDEQTGAGQNSRIAEAYPDYSPPAEIILDDGKDVGGVPEFAVIRETGNPTLQAGYSEAFRFAGPTGDMGANGLFGSGTQHRFDTDTVSGPGVDREPLRPGR